MKPSLSLSGEDHNAVKLAWEEFISTGNVTQHQPRPIILEAWQQSLQQGIDPTIDRAPSLLEPDELDIKLNCEDLGRVGRPILERLSSSLHNTKHVIVLANADGHILHSVGHQAIQSQLEAINFMPGGTWSVDTVGPNGVGTPLVMGQAELICGTEHYCEAWQPWACYGSPIHDNAGNVMGCIDITGPVNDLSSQTMSLAMSIAHSVESGLNLLSLQKREILRGVYQQRKSKLKNNLSLLLDEQGTVLEMDERLSNRLGLNTSETWMTSLPLLNKELWQRIQACLLSTDANEFDLVMGEEEMGHVIVEPIKRHDISLGSLVIFENSNELTMTGQSSIAADDFRSKSDQLIRDALAEANGNISKAARILGINRTTIYRRLKLLNTISTNSNTTKYK